MRKIKTLMLLFLTAIGCQLLGCNGGDNDDIFVPFPTDFGTLSLTVPRFYVLEGQTANITVARAGGSTGEVTVDFATSDGSAVAGLNYQQAAGTLVFPQGNALQEFEVNTLDDAVDNGARTVNITISNAQGGAALGDQVTAVLTIFDNDATLVGLTANQELVRFNASSPGALLGTAAITGLNPGETVLAIDFRPSEGVLYGFTSANRLLVLNPTTGAAVPQGDPLSTALSGAAFGADFNPVVDRLREVSNNTQNSRINPATGAVTVDGALAYAAADVNAAATPNVAGAAYANNFPGATTTTLFDIDTTLDVLAIQNPPNDGTLNTVGPLGLDITDQLGFDITAGGSAFAAVNTGNPQSTLTQVDLASGTLFEVGPLAGGIQLLGLSAVPPAPVQNRLVGLTTANNLVTFAPNDPGTILSTVAVTGLQVGEQLNAIDYRPAENTLYGLGSTSTLYTINLSTGAATALPPGFAVVGLGFGFDFNPTVDRIRITDTMTDNIRVNPNTGALAATDTNLAYAAGDPNFGTAPQVAGSAYTNNIAGATNTSLFDLDVGLDVLVFQNPPNAGQLTTIGALGFNTDELVGFDIDIAGTAFAALHAPAAPVSVLMTVNLGTGATTQVGSIGGGVPLRGLTVAPAGTP